jgi:hypothetical protein
LYWRRAWLYIWCNFIEDIIMPIIGTFKTLEVGKRTVIPKLSDKDAVYHYNVPVFVLREATKEEYVKGAMEDNAEGFEREVARGADAHNSPNAKFYEVSMD